MFKTIPTPPRNLLTPRAIEFAYPAHTETARARIAQAAREDDPDALNPRKLTAAAIAATKHEDFGDAPLADPLETLCASLGEEMDLHALGRQFVRQQLIGLLTTRLKLVALWRRRPEILHQKIERPIIIIGLPRSGTTILQRMLCRDPIRRWSPFWEQVIPLPIDDGGGAPDPRIELVQNSLDTLYTLAPDLAQMHEVAIDEPDEDISQLMYGFSSMQFEWSYVVPSYSRFYQAADHTQGYVWFRRVLQTMQWLKPGSNRWILKAPQHLEQLPALVAAFPDAVLVQTHREPASAVISLASLTTYGQRRYFDHPNPHAVGANIANIVERLLQAGVASRAHLTQPIVDISFSDLLSDPIECVKRIYRVAGDALSDEGEAHMRAWIDDNRQGKHGGHIYAAEDFGLDAAELRKRFDFYRARFAES